MNVRRASELDVPPVVETLVGAFDADPLWSWVFDDDASRAGEMRQLWGLCVRGGRRYDTVSMTAGGEAVAVWIPPGGTELTHEQEAELDAFVAALPGHRGTRAQLAFDLLDERHPPDPAHHYLSLLGTHPLHRGHGYGMRLLAADLAAIDAEGAPAYLESSNPANVPRYEAHGFRATGTIEFPDAGPIVTTMWRDAR